MQSNKHTPGPRGRVAAFCNQCGAPLATVGATRQQTWLKSATARSPGMLPGQGGGSWARAPRAGEYGFHALKIRIWPDPQHAIYGPIRRGYPENTQAKRPYPDQRGKRLCPGEDPAAARSGRHRPVAPRGREALRKQKQKSAAGCGRALGLLRAAAGEERRGEERRESLLRPLPSWSSLRGSPRCLTPRRAEGSAAERLSKSIICSLEKGFSKGSLRLY